MVGGESERYEGAGAEGPLVCILGTKSVVVVPAGSDSGSNGVVTLAVMRRESTDIPHNRALR
jgi:hypothetical protein